MKIVVVYSTKPDDGDDWIYVFDNMKERKSYRYSDWDENRRIVTKCRHNKLTFTCTQNSYLFFHHLNKVPYHADV